MTTDRDDIIRMAREAGWAVHSYNAEIVEHFFKLAYEAGAAAEREACAIAGGAAADAGLNVAAAIRARGQQRPEPTYPRDPIWREQKRLEMEAWARAKLARARGQQQEPDDGPLAF